MVRIFPFKGIFYNKKKIKQLASVVSPPYDIIDPQLQGALYEQNEFNFIRLILGKDFPGDNDYNNRHVRAAAFLNGWLRHKILLKDDKPAFYVYQQKFSAGGKKFARIGFFGALRIEDVGRGRVYPHEETYSRAKLDRLQLLRATNANFDSVFSFYSDKKEKIQKLLKSFMRRKPLLEIKDADNVVHGIWKVDRRAAHSKIMQEMKDKVVFIADGHHRYEAALRFKNEMKTKNTKFTEEEAYNHILMYFTPLEDNGLLVLPIHRVVSNLEYYDPSRFEQDLSLYFEVIPYPATKNNSDKIRKKLIKDLEKAGETKHAFGIYLGDHRYFLLLLKDEKSIEEMVAEEKPKAWKKLDVNILHYVIFDRLLNIAQETEDKITYTKDVDEAVKLVDGKGANLAIILNPTKIEEIVTIASELERLPQKSTYFYPKLLSGLIMLNFENEEKITA